MNILKQHTSFNDITLETLVIGVTKNMENSPLWAELIAFAGEALTTWLQSGEISSDKKKLTKLPVLLSSNSGHHYHKQGLFHCFCMFQLSGLTLFRYHFHSI